MEAKRWIVGCLLFLLVQLNIWARVEIHEEFRDENLSIEWELTNDPSVRWMIDKEGFLSINFDVEETMRGKDEHFFLLRPVGKGDWTMESRLIIAAGSGYETGLLVYTNEEISYRWGVRCFEGKSEPEYFDGLMSNEMEGWGRTQTAEESDITLRIIKIGSKLELQYWDDFEQDFIAYSWARYKQPITKIGVYANSQGVETVVILFDYFKLIR